MLKNRFKGLAFALVMAIIFALTGCAQNADNSQTTVPKTAIATTATAETAILEERIALGQGKTTFNLDIEGLDGTDSAGFSKRYSISTDEIIVGNALLELELISGDETNYGLYVTEVDGVTADYDTDGTYWAFFIDDEYASAGIDSTEITQGATYKLAISK